MPKTRPPDAPGLQMIDPVRAGRDPIGAAREFEPSAQAIRPRVATADRRSGRTSAPVADGTVLTAPETEALLRLRRENEQLRLALDILSRATAWFAGETGVIPSGSSHP